MKMVIFRSYVNVYQKVWSFLERNTRKSFSSWRVHGLKPWYHRDTVAEIFSVSRVSKDVVAKGGKIRKIETQQYSKRRKSGNMSQNLPLLTFWSMLYLESTTMKNIHYSIVKDIRSILIHERIEPSQMPNPPVLSAKMAKPHSNRRGITCHVLGRVALGGSDKWQGSI